MHTFILKSKIDKKMFPSILFSKTAENAGYSRFSRELGERT
jgi:hypothetical protein